MMHPHVSDCNFQQTTQEGAGSTTCRLQVCAGASYSMWPCQQLPWHLQPAGAVRGCNLDHFMAAHQRTQLLKNLGKTLHAQIVSAHVYILVPWLSRSHACHACHGAMYPKIPGINSWIIRPITHAQLLRDF